MNDIKIISIKDIDPFNNHPFKVIEDESLKTLAESIKENGLLNPVIVRKKDNDKYEMISGHRRLKAIELNGEDFIKCEVKELSDDEATIFMVDSNMYRDKILPSEKAFAYKMKLDAIKHQGITCGHDGHKSRDSINSESGRKIQRYIRLTNLVPKLLELVDNTILYDKRTTLTMGLLPAIELSYLSQEAQNLVVRMISYEDMTPSHNQAKRIRELYLKKLLTANAIEEIFREEKGNQHEKISFSRKRIMNALPPELINRDKRCLEEYIIEAINSYNKKLERKQLIDELNSKINI